MLLHGNPTSSHLWRHVLARAPGTGHRWIAPDLIGMGSSPKPDIAYTLADHIAHVDAFLSALDVSDPVLVGHDWGVAIALDRLRRFPSSVRGVAFMEAHLRPLPGWEAIDDLFRSLRAPGVGERMVLEENFFIDTLLPAALNRSVPLSAYQAPYPTPESRRPLLAWARQIPIGGEPASSASLMAAAAAGLTNSEIPKLLLHGGDGVLITPPVVAWCRANVSNLTVTDVGPAGHFLPEDRPEEVADALIGWVGGLPVR